MSQVLQWASVIWGTFIALVQDVGTAALGTLGGALLAFRLELGRQERSEKARQRAAGQRALFVLVSQATVLKNLRKQALERVRSDPHREYKIRHMIGGDQGLYLESGELMFLLESNDPDVLLRVFQAEHWYKTAMKALDARNDARIEFEDVIGSQGIRHGLSHEQILERIPPHVVSRLRTLTDGLYEAVDEGSAVIWATIESLQSALRSLFPNEKQLTVKPIEEASSANHGSPPPAQDPP